jgi:predicted nucleic acid-binding protein
MILVDTSIWADHYRQPLQTLSELLNLEQIVQHPYVTAEMALGNSRDRTGMIAFFMAIDQVPISPLADLMAFVEAKTLWGTGLGFVDTHLLASAARIGCKLWSRDKRLTVQAERLGYSYQA